MNQHLRTNKYIYYIQWIYCDISKTQILVTEGSLIKTLIPIFIVESIDFVWYIRHFSECIGNVVGELRLRFPKHEIYSNKTSLINFFGYAYIELFPLATVLTEKLGTLIQGNICITPS